MDEGHDLKQTGDDVAFDTQTSVEPMSGMKLKSGRNKQIPSRGLVAILGGLCLVIVALGVGIIVMANLSGGGEVVVVDEESEEYIATTATPEQLAAYATYEEKYDAVRAKAKELLSETPVDVAAIMQLYTEAYNEYDTMETYDYAQGFLSAELEDLMSGGFKQEMLEVLTAVDYNIYPLNIRHRRYLQIINLARELGNTEVVAEYEALAATTEAAYEQSGEAIRRQVAEDEARRSSRIIEGEEE